MKLTFVFLSEVDEIMMFSVQIFALQVPFVSSSQLLKQYCFRCSSSMSSSTYLSAFDSSRSWSRTVLG